MIPNPPRRYAAHEALVAPARTRAALWRLVLGVVLAAVVTVGLGQTIALAVGGLLMALGAESQAQELRRMAGPVAVLVLLLASGAMGVGGALAARLLHGRAPLGLIGPVPAAVGQFVRVVIALFGLYLLVGILMPGTGQAPPRAGLAPGLWLLLLPLSATAVLIQTGAEEVLFRGYLQQQVAARFRHPAVWMILPSALFALGHHAPSGFGANAAWVTLWAFVFGLAMADLTARAGTLGPAIAVHFVNNFWAILIISMDGPMGGLSLYVLPFGPGTADAVAQALPVEFAMIGLQWLAARVALRR